MNHNSYKIHRAEAERFVSENAAGLYGLRAHEKAQETFKKRGKTISNEFEFKERITTISEDLFLLSNLQQDSINEISVPNIEKSDLKNFFGASILSELEINATRMKTSAESSILIQGGSETIKASADQGWKELIKKNAKAIAELQADPDLPKNPEKQEQLQLLISQINSENEESWKYEERRKFEKLQNKPLGKVIAPHTLDILKKYVAEAVLISVDSVRNYLLKETKEVKTVYEKNKNSFSAKAQRNIEAQMIFCNEKMIGQTFDIKTLERIQKGIAVAKMEIKEMAHENNAVSPEKIRKLFGDLQKTIATYPGDVLKNTDFKKKLKDIEGRMAILEQLPKDELGYMEERLLTFQNQFHNIDFKKQLEKMDPKKNSDADKARRVLSQIQHLTDAKQIQEILAREIPPTGEPPKDRVEYVKHKVFEEKYRAYTTTGYMVFYQKGDEWKIIIDKDAIKKKGVGEKFKNQLAHELLHLEFEKNKELKEGLIKIFTENPKWPEIKEAYAKAYPEKTPPQFPANSKGPFHASQWKNEDVVSELYAMQYELGKETVAEKGKGLFVAKLNNLIVSSKIFEALTGEKLEGINKLAKSRQERTKWAEALIQKSEWTEIERTYKNWAGKAAKGLKGAVLAEQIFDTQGALPAKLKALLEKADITIQGYEEVGLVRGSEAGAAHEHETPAEADHGQEEHNDHGEGHGGGGHGGHGGHEGGDHDLTNVSRAEQEFIHLEHGIQGLLDSEYLDHIQGGRAALNEVMAYHHGTKKLIELNEKNSSNILAKAIKDRFETAKTLTKEFTHAIGKAADSMKNSSINFIQKLWNNTTVMSLEDFFHAGKDIKEYVERIWERRGKDHAARLGQALFAGSGILEGLGAEARAKQLEAEQEEVNKWKERYEHLDPWQLEDALATLARATFPNKDQLKAVLRQLAEKGRLDWHNPNLWKVLNKLQSDTEFKEHDHVLHTNPIVLRQKLHTAFTAIWDAEEFGKLEKESEEHYEHGMEAFNVNFERMADQMSPILDGMLQRHIQRQKGGNVKKVDPIEFEAAIRFCITQGKSTSERVYFHIMAGIAHGLLPADRGLAIDDKFLNDFPPTQWIYGFNPPLTQHDFKNFCTHYFKDEFTNGSPGDKFQHFYWTQIMNSEAVIQRVRKSASEVKWDHDWSRSIAAIGDADAAQRFLEGRSGRKETKSTAVENAYVGALQWFEENALSRNADIDLFVRQIQWVSMANGIYEHVAFKHKGSDIYTRDSGGDNNVPREAGVGKHAKWTLGQHREKINKFVYSFDEYFFRLIWDRKRANERGADGKLNEKSINEMGTEARDHLLKNYGDMFNEKEKKDIESIASIDNVYENMNIIIRAIILKNKGKFKQNMKLLTSDL